MDVYERFLSKIQKEPGTGDPATGCWLWTAGKTAKGYGEFNITHERTVYAHRFIYEWQVGRIPQGLVIDHICRVRHCVNPDHLRPVTPRGNVTARGSLSPAKWGPERTRCKYGHALTEDNVYRRPGKRQNSRECRQCIREQSSRKYYRKKET